MLTMVTKRPLKPDSISKLFQDSEPEGKPATPQGHALGSGLSGCYTPAATAEMPDRSVSEFFAVGK